jgi:hypothetical protein
MQSTSSSIWHRECDPDPVAPAPLASEWEVAKYLNEMGHCGYEPTPVAVVRFCRNHGHTQRPDFKISKVAEGLVALGAVDTRRYLGEIAKGNVWQWAALDRPGYVERCPNLIWRMDRLNGDLFSFFDDCNSRRCGRKCALRRAESDLLWACRVFRSHEVIWHAIVPNDKAIVGRMKTRHSRRNRGGGMLWIRRSDSATVHFYATGALSGRDEPRSGEWLHRRDALQQIASVDLALPGTDKVWFSGSWARPSATDSGPPNEPTTFRLGEAPYDLMTDAITRAERVLKERRGLWRTDLTADQVERIWLPLVQEEVEAEWEILRSGKKFKD